MKEYTFKLTEQEANLILSALSKESYANVFELINKLHLQANEQADKEKSK